ncbi:tumor necrosis factor-inducible gene 6 protein-like [Branchiostoma lanceolatum]|uniref:tumor necrosis factor-inducible gene 6 protein-like n=1 Tax=Branchiostoma lanceolatum TaxID=7740 RepID=UPI003456B01F
MASSFPAGYQSDADCTWTIHGEGYPITLTFTDFALEDGGFFSGCPYDFVEIYAGRTKIGTYCGSDMPPRLTTIEQVRIKFQSDSSVEEQGFRFEYMIDGPPTTTMKPETTTKPEGSGEGSGEDLSEDSFLI